MAKDKRHGRAAKGAKRAAKFADELRYKLERYRLDDQSSALIDRILQSIEEFRRHQHDLAERLAGGAAPSIDPPTG